MRQPLILVALLVIAGFGAYRAFRYGSGARRLMGVVPVLFMALGGVVAPLVLGVAQEADTKPSVAGIGGGELLVVRVVGSLLLAVASGAILTLMFRPPRG